MRRKRTQLVPLISIRRPFIRLWSVLFYLFGETNLTRRQEAIMYDIIAFKKYVNHRENDRVHLPSSIHRSMCLHSIISFIRAVRRLELFRRVAYRLDLLNGFLILQSAKEKIKWTENVQKRLNCELNVNNWIVYVSILYHWFHFS